MENSIWKLLKELGSKKGITEIIINNQDMVYIEREGELIRLNVAIDPNDLLPFCHDVAKLNKVEFSPDYPILDGTLQDGSRINIISGDYTNSGPAITIRKYLRDITTFGELEGKFNISEKWIEFFKCLVAAKSNIIISGGTGVGKTTFLNLLLQEIPPTERIITLEDTKELKFKNPNTVRMFTANASSNISNPLDMRALVKNTLRMRPDRIVIGEVRGPEAFDLLQVMNTGHDGSMCTVHSNSPSEALMRLENLFLFAGYDVPLKAIRHQMSTAIDYIIQLDRDRELGRVVSKITEVTRMEGDIILLQDIGDRSDMGPVFTGLVPSKIQHLFDAGLDPNFFADL
jgi:pilus assembly protein CpaF